jgi:hypothetical protein
MKCGQNLWCLNVKPDDTQSNHRALKIWVWTCIYYVSEDLWIMNQNWLKQRFSNSCLPIVVDRISYLCPQILVSFLLYFTSSLSSSSSSSQSLSYDESIVSSKTSSPESVVYWSLFGTQNLLVSFRPSSSCLCLLPRVPITYVMWYDIFNCNWVATQWQ